MPVTSSYNGKLEKQLGILAGFIRDYPIVVGGSAVISAICEVDFPGSDIDLYVGYKIRRRENLNIDHPFNDFIVEEMGGVLADNVNYQNKSYKYICPNITINIIHTGVETKREIIKYINDTADLDICTSTFDGFETRFTISVLTKNASVINQHLIESTFESTLLGKDREDAFKKFSAIFMIKRKTRQVKYINRGFFIMGTELDEVDYYNATSFISNQEYKESIVRDTLNFVVTEIKKNIESGSSNCLDDILKGRHIFPFRNDAPILPIHYSLTYEYFRWAKKWI